MYTCVDIDLYTYMCVNAKARILQISNIIFYINVMNKEYSVL